MRVCHVDVNVYMCQSPATAMEYLMFLSTICLLLICARPYLHDISRLFSICRFHEITGAYPSKITVVSFSFKRRRFETQHAPALHWPAHRFAYVGVDPPASTGFNLAEATQGELENAAKPFESDPYGCHSAALQAKRKARNPFSRIPPYELSCPDMKELLHYCGPELFPKDQLPWKDLN
jgi:hypothetical protein